MLTSVGLLLQLAGAPARVPPAPVSPYRVELEEPELGPVLWHSLGLMTTMRVAEAILYPSPFASIDSEFVRSNYARAYTSLPLWDPDGAPASFDGDPWTINIIGHGLFGSELYMRARTCHYGVWGSLAWTVTGSVAWEYVFEASGVQPSAQDLVYTPIAGLLLGEARYFAWSAARRAQGAWWSRVVRWTVDPLGGAERALFTRC